LTGCTKAPRFRSLNREASLHPTRRSSGRVAQLLGSLGIQIWVFLFLVFFGSEIVHLDPLLRLTTQVLFVVPLAVWAVLRLRGPRDWLDYAVLASVAIFGVVCLASRDRIGSLETLGLVLTYALLFWAMRAMQAGSWARDAFATGAATAMAFSLALNAFLWINEKVAWVLHTGTPPQFEAFEVFPWETANVMPVLVLLTIPFIAWVPLRPVRAVLWLVVGASALVLVPFSVGRAGWLAIALAAALFIQMRTDVVGRAWRRLPSGVGRLAVTAVVGALALAALAVVAVPLFRGLAESGRILIWQSSLAMFADRPISGNGPGIYSWARLLYPPEGAPLIHVRLTHDVPLQTLADGGLLLAAGLLLALGVWLVTALRRRQSWGWPEHLALSALAGFVLASLLDDFSFLPAVTAMVVTMAAWLAGPAATRQGSVIRPGRWRPMLAPAVVALLAVLAVPAVVAGDISRNEALLARTAAVNGEWALAADHFARAALLHPADAGYELGLGMAYSYLGADIGAQDAYQEARDRNPGDPRAAGGLAALTDDLDERIELLRDASARTFGDPQYAYRLGIAEAERGEPDAAAAAFAHAVVLNPPLFGALPFEATGVSRRAVADAVDVVLANEHQAAPILDLIARWDVALAMGSLPSDPGLAWQAVAAELSGDRAQADEAVAQLEDKAPQDARTYQAAAAVARLRCDAAAEDEALRLEAFTRNAWTPAPPRVHVVRELVYREAGLGATQPLQAEAPPALPRWPWSLIAPAACG
jgi:O-antigen ligase